MNEPQSRFDTIKLATQYWHGDASLSTLIIIIFVLTFIILLLGGFIVQRYFKRKNVYRYFISYAKSRELTDEEIEILWKYAQQMERDPILVLEFKPPFEKVVDLYIKSDPNPKESLVQDMRKKLDFIIQSPYIPLVTTKDIEIFQNGKLFLPNRQSLDIALYDKDERYMYWLVIDNNLPTSVTPQTTVKIVFIRPDDGIYTLFLPVEEIVKDGGKTLLKLPHTFEFQRVQRREYPRVHVSLPATIVFEDQEGKTIRITGLLDDISAGGARMCTDDMEHAKLLRYGTTVTFKTKLEDLPIETKLRILDIETKQKSICLRGNFIDIDESTQTMIMDFVQKEIIRISQLRQQ